MSFPLESTAHRREARISQTTHAHSAGSSRRKRGVDVNPLHTMRSNGIRLLLPAQASDGHRIAVVGLQEPMAALDASCQPRSLTTCDAPSIAGTRLAIGATHVLAAASDVTMAARRFDCERTTSSKRLENW